MHSKNRNNRREFLKATGKAGLAAGLSFTILPSMAARYDELNPGGSDGKAEEIPYEQQPLSYGYAALEPAIDAMTMEIHYSKHAATYAKNLADAVKAEGINPKTDPLIAVLNKISKFSPKMRNNGGGHYNHEFFWRSMKTPGVMNAVQGNLQKAMVKDFGSVEAFKTQFAEAGKNRFGSGWAWLVLGAGNKLIVGSTPNQDNPLMDASELKGTPLLGLDVWEHAYYLKYQNKRPDYINSWWSVVNWEVVAKRFEKAK